MAGCERLRPSLQLGPFLAIRGVECRYWSDEISLGEAMRLILLFGAPMLSGCQKVDPAPAVKTAEPVGRYQVVQSRERRGDLLVDTASGRTWVSSRLVKNGNRLVWLPVSRLDDPLEAEEFVGELARQKAGKRDK